jgi:glycosyltransferase involved in cell wall biosynthesis
VLLDTPRHANYFAETFGLHPTKLRALPVGCNEDIFYPRTIPPNWTRTTRVLYYSSYLPLHGTKTVIRAAALLRSEPNIYFRLIGQGQEYMTVRKQASDLGLTNIAFLPPVPIDALPAEIASSDICLGGHFGHSAKAGRVVPGKIYQMLAMARPVIAANTPANNDLLVHEQSAYLCPPDDPLALADAVLTLHRNKALRQNLASEGHDLYRRRCSEPTITATLGDLLHEMMN